MPQTGRLQWGTLTCSMPNLRNQWTIKITADIWISFYWHALPCGCFLNKSKCSYCSSMDKYWFRPSTSGAWKKLKLSLLKSPSNMDMTCVIGRRKKCREIHCLNPEEMPGHRFLLILSSCQYQVLYIKWFSRTYTIFVARSTWKIKQRPVLR